MWESSRVHGYSGKGGNCVLGCGGAIIILVIVVVVKVEAMLRMVG